MESNDEYHSYLAHLYGWCNYCAILYCDENIQYLCAKQIISYIFASSLLATLVDAAQLLPLLYMLSWYHKYFHMTSTASQQCSAKNHCFEAVGKLFDLYDDFFNDYFNVWLYLAQLWTLG